MSDYFHPIIDRELLWITGAQIGSILGPTLATQAEYVGIVSLYLLGSAVMFMMVTAMYFYVDKFGMPLKSDADGKDESKKKKSGKSEEGVSVFIKPLSLVNDIDVITASSQ